MPCPYCGTPMSNPRRVQCGAPECFRAWRNQRQREYLASRKAQDGQRYEDRYKVERICSDCGGTFLTRHGQRCYPCARRWLAKRGAEARGRLESERAAARKQLVPAGPLRRAETRRYREALERLSRAASGTRPKNAIWVNGACVRCDAPFVCMLTGDFPRYCSRRCQRADYKARERLYFEHCDVESFTPEEIFERDGWRCQIPGCGRRVKRTAVAPHPLAPTLDHIIPRSEGGDHTRANVRCAHFICNSRRGNRGGNDQLLLVG